MKVDDKVIFFIFMCRNFVFIHIIVYFLSYKNNEEN